MVPAGEKGWKPPETNEARKPSDTGTIKIRFPKDGAIDYTFNAIEIKAIRTDIFKPGHFAMFDILLHLDKRGEIALEYHFDEGMDTHVIDTINGIDRWWYDAHYSSGWFEDNAFRMDMYPYKNESEIVVYRVKQGLLDRIYESFREEIERLAANNGRVIVPSVIIESPSFSKTFEGVEVTAHNIRSDVLQPGVITAMDILLSLAEQGKLTPLKLTWYDQIAGADPVDSYFVEQMDEAIAFANCGFVYEAGSQMFGGFMGNHIHIPSDVRTIISPYYGYWFWICI